MKINLDPVIAGRIKKAWAALSAEQQNRIAPILAQANQQAIAVSTTGVAPPPDSGVAHQALLAHSAITDDRDGLVNSLQSGVVFDVSSGGEIWGTGKYQQLDPGWAESVACWLEHLIVGRHAFSTTPPTIPIPNDIKIAIAGDWGTGNWRPSPNLAPSTDVGHYIKLLNPDLSIHLGDVYYAGTSDEETHLFVDLWPAGALGSLTLNSNHEMYSGAGPYFETALGSAVFQMQQKCSYFALENDNWVIVGLDSAYYSDPHNLYTDGSLNPANGPTVQVDFLKAQVAKRKNILVLTHHNGLSVDGGSTNVLWTQVMSAFDAGSGPAYWYWGHAHAAAVYKPTAPVKVLCRCCGHGALPWGQASALANSTSVLWYEHRPAHDADIPLRVLNGFAMLQLSGANLTETFYDENGGVAWSSSAPAV